MIALRLVIDTNTIVSAALKPDGLPRTVMVVATQKPATLYITEAILDEYRDVLSRREFNISRGLRKRFIELIRDRARMVKPSRLPLVTKDPGDNKFVECADAARADYLVTGNLKHFPAYWKKTKVITSREFVDIVAPHLIS